MNAFIDFAKNVNQAKKNILLILFHVAMNTLWGQLSFENLLNDRNRKLLIVLIIFVFILLGLSVERKMFDFFSASCTFFALCLNAFLNILKCHGWFTKNVFL
jgi:hypothetical protein